MTQLAGPKLAGGLGPGRRDDAHARLREAGVYKLKAVNVQTSAEMSLQTLGADNRPLLIVRVR